MKLWGTCNCNNSSTSREGFWDLKVGKYVDTCISSEYIWLHIGFSDEWYCSNSTCSFGLCNLVLLYIHTCYSSAMPFMHPASAWHGGCPVWCACSYEPLTTFISYMYIRVGLYYPSMYWATGDVVKCFHVLQWKFCSVAHHCGSKRNIREVELRLWLIDPRCFEMDNTTLTR